MRRMLGLSVIIIVFLMAGKYPKYIYSESENKQDTQIKHVM